MSSDDPTSTSDGRSRSRHRIHRDVPEEGEFNVEIRPTPGTRRGSNTSQRSVAVTAPRLTGNSERFSRIPRGDFALCKRFIEEHPSVLNDSTAEYLADGQSALASGRVAAAEACVQQALLLQKVNDKPARDRARFLTRFLDDLIRRSRSSLEEFNNNFDESMGRLRQLVQQLEAQAAAREAAARETPPATNRGSERTAVLQDRRIDNRVASNAANLPGYQPRNRLTTVPEQGSTEATGGRNTRSNAPTRFGPGGVIEGIDERYIVYESSFFVFGRVFATLWHTSPGTSRRPGWNHQGRFGEQVLSHIQRMVVVKEDHGSSWCIPINTYNGRGVLKFRENRGDIHAHAIIHMSDTEPTTPDWEPSMPKEPIAVIPAGRDQKLDEMSRINFGKVHTLEHNIKVMNVGKIAPRSMSFFLNYWQTKLQEHPTRAGR